MNKLRVNHDALRQPEPIEDWLDPWFSIVSAYTDRVYKDNQQVIKPCGQKTRLILYQASTQGQTNPYKQWNTFATMIGVLACKIANDLPFKEVVLESYPMSLPKSNSGEGKESMLLYTANEVWIGLSIDRQYFDWQYTLYALVARWEE